MSPDWDFDNVERQFKAICSTMEGTLEQKHSIFFYAMTDICTKSDDSWSMMKRCDLGLDLQTRPERQ